MSDSEPVNLLLVDDLEENLLALEGLLRGSGVRLLRANSGPEALEILLVHEIALAIIDVQMPGMDGFELAELMSGAQRTRRVPIIFLTAAAFDDQRRFRGYEAGAVDFLFKPVEPQILRSKVDVFIELYRQRQEIARHEREMRSLADHSPDMIARYDRQNRHVFVNAAVASMSGLSFEAILGKTNRQLGMPGDLCDCWEAALQSAFGTGQPGHFEFSLQGAQGARTFESRLVPETGPQSRIDYVLAITRDVTSARQAEHQVAQARDAAEKANAAKDQFLAALSHELRTPLTPVRMAISMWEEKEGLFPPDLRDDLAMVRRNVDLECRLIDDMLDLNRITLGKLELQLSRVDVHEELNHAVGSVQAEAAAKSLKLCFVPEAVKTIVSADAGRLQQILWNLLKNAVKFTSPGGSVTIRTHNSGSQAILVEVSDTGVGIDPEHIGHIFNAFEQGGDQVTRQFGGLGLGLAISKALTDMHGGELRAQSEGKDRGATFTLELHLSDSLKSVAEHPQSIAPTNASQRADNPKARILLVEDHADTARVLSKLLERRGYSVETAGRVAEAISIAQLSSFELIITDLGLPDGSGYDLIRELHKLGPIKGIALSGFGSEEDVRRSDLAGFQAHLTKPVDLNQLVTTINSVLYGAHASIASDLS